MKNAMLVRILAVTLVAAAGSCAMAQDAITLFGQTYRVQRLDYSQQVGFPGVTFPSDTVKLFEVEGAHWLGNDKLLMSADDMTDLFIGEPDNWIVEINVVTGPGGVVSLTPSRRLVTVADFDLNPGGITVNNSPTGLGANGNLVVGGNDGFLSAFALNGTNSGSLLQTNTNQLCPVQSGGCLVNITGTNFNLEDITFVPAIGNRPAQLMTINQDLGGLDITGVERRGTNGALLGSFPVGGTVFPALAGGVSKGITYMPDSPKLPAQIRRPEGVLLVSFDRGFPALQAFDIDGNLIATEILTTTGTPQPPFRLDMIGCSLRLHLESLAADPITGRLFLVNQGNFNACNYMWVLTPACASDIAGPGPSVGPDGELTADDIILFISWFTSGNTQADIASPGPTAGADGEFTADDVILFISRFTNGC